MSDALLDRFQALLAGRYAIQRELGRGGMATVYLARDLRHGREVAIKLLQPEITTSLTAERFLREIQITASLQHPNILGLIDSGAEDGLCYYVMPYIEGESLRERLLWEKQLQVEQAVRAAVQVASALAYAHSRQVIHRDIKPENILYSAGHAIVADFGIARAVTEGQRTITAVGIPLGTPPYMSPEQAQGLDNIDHRSDIYALGCVLFEMLAGRPPFIGTSLGKVIQQHLQAPPPPLREFRPDAPQALETILARSLVKDRNGRYQSAEEMLEALRLVSAAETLERSMPTGIRQMMPAMKPEPPPGYTAELAALKKVDGGRRFLVGGLLVVIAAMAGAGYLMMGRSVPGDRSVAVLRPEIVAGGDGFELFPPAMTLAIQSELRKIKGLRIVSDASVSGMQARGLSVRQLADSLHAQLLVSGTVQPDGRRVHVTMQLVDAVKDNVLWSESEGFSLDSLVQGQQRMAEKVAKAVRRAAKGN